MARTGGTVQGNTYVGGTRKHIGQVCGFWNLENVVPAN